MSRYKAYPEYKDSGVEWLGNIPLSWNVVSIKRQAQIFNGATPKSEVTDFWDGDISWITPADLGKDKSPYIMSGARSITAAGYKSCGTNLVPRDSVILSSRAPIGTLGIAAQELCTNQGCKSLVTGKKLDSKFLFYVLLSSSTQLNLLGRGTTFLEISADELGSYKISFPPTIDQRTIATFLDHETAKIDALIEKQERLIELLKEKRQAVISHAVTKGLNPNAPMKDSGVEWLGEVPAHWALGKCGFYASILPGYAFQSSGFSDCEDNTKLLRGINVGVSRLKWDDVVYWKRTPTDGLDMYALKEGDIVIGMDRPLISEGIRVAKIASTDLPCLLLQRVASIKTNEKLDADYLLLLLSSKMFAAHFTPDTTGISVPHISPDQIGNFVIPIPEIDEQKQIVSSADIQSRQLLELIDRAESAISLMQERRTALISAAVTGKIDVRDWQATAATAAA